jgi:hypothetical protein
MFPAEMSLRLDRDVHQDAITGEARVYLTTHLGAAAAAAATAAVLVFQGSKHQKLENEQR